MTIFYLAESRMEKSNKKTTFDFKGTSCEKVTFQEGEPLFQLRIIKLHEVRWNALNEQNAHLF